MSARLKATKLNFLWRKKKTTLKSEKKQQVLSASQVFALKKETWNKNIIYIRRLFFFLPLL